MLLTTKGTINPVKRQHKEWKRIFARYMSDAKLVSGIYKELKDL